MTFPPPPLVREHDRLAHEVAAAVLRRLEAAPALGDALRDALVRAFAHDAELLVERLNDAPALHRDAFLDKLVRPAAAPVPASAPLQFSTVPVDGPPPVVPRHTRVAAPPRQGETEAVVFETCADLEPVCARLERAVAVGGQPQRVADVGDLLAGDGRARPMLAESVLAERAFHVTQPLVFDAPGLSGLRVMVALAPGARLPDGMAPEWGIATQGGFIAMAPQSDGSAGLTRSGELAFAIPPAWPPHEVAGTRARWLTCRLRPSTAPVDAGASPAGMPTPARDGPLASCLASLQLASEAVLPGRPPERIFSGVLAIEPGADFFAFGERPRFGDMLFIQSDAFALAGARVTIEIGLANPAGAADSPLMPVGRSGKPVLGWEAWTAVGWTPVRVHDDTEALSASGAVRLQMPDDAGPARVNGVEGGWLRVRLVSGSYLADPLANPAVIPLAPQLPPALAPPVIASISVQAILQRGPMAPAQVVVEHNLQQEPLAGIAARQFVPFPPPEDGAAFLYLGLSAPDTTLAGRTLHLFAGPADTGERLFVRGAADPIAPVRWQVRGRDGWRECSVVDGTGGLRAPGLVDVTLDADVAAWPTTTLDPRRSLVWLRAVCDAPDGAGPPPLARVALNVVPAVQQLTLEHELLGSGNGRPAQQVVTARAPVIGELVLEVGVPRRSTPNPGRRADGRRVARDIGSDWSGVVDPPHDLAAPVLQWERWTEVDDFSGSGEDARHFTLDRLGGIVAFGDGAHGRIPPAGPNNIRARSYRTGSGRRGNLGAGAITQLRTTIPHVVAVTNPAPAVGGRDSDDDAMLRRSAAAWLRHRDRAIARDDYADLARQAAPEVARAACVANADLAADPLAGRRSPGVVSVIVVPSGSEDQPQPTRGLLGQIKAYLDARCPLGVDVVVLGPLYLAFSVDVEIALAPGRAPGPVVAACVQAMRGFLHPLTGARGEGWQPGERPHTSDFYPLIAAVDGIDHIRGVRLRAGGAPELLDSGMFLVSSGVHQVRT